MTANTCQDILGITRATCRKLSALSASRVIEDIAKNYDTGFKPSFTSWLKVRESKPLAM
jgi:hypothetical protein